MSALIEPKAVLIAAKEVRAMVSVGQSRVLRASPAHPSSSFRSITSLIVGLVLALGLCQATWAQGPAATDNGATLFENVRIFNGKSGVLSPPSNVLVRGNVIERISASPITAEANVRVVPGGGRVLMPGLTDAHWHAMMVRATPAVILGSDVGYTTLLAAGEATATLMRGFTTVRDMGGPSFSMKRAIDEGAIPGPRIYPSGA
ncbi:MAG TPA: amidohydrolase family protein, partial [Phenylobacterium sp.]|nr:amidohydrolase family protein [Phenylobacterium sp.]